MLLGLQKYLIIQRLTDLSFTPFVEKFAMARSNMESQPPLDPYQFILTRNLILLLFLLMRKSDPFAFSPIQVTQAFHLAYHLVAKDEEINAAKAALE